MSKIRILSEDVANRIAAGEVIERPASVVKELVENSLDAGATRIRVSIEKSGIKLIAVTDNGMGMDEDDALCCFEPHGTSKIVTDSDLHSVISYGFRGEAIPSIASVSRTTLRTRTNDSTSGFEVEVNSGKITKIAPVGCAIGTEFLVKDLFFNVPARRKFLRSEATEERHIFDVILNMALPNPNVFFELKFDGRTAFQSPASDDILPRMQCFFGKTFAEEMLPVSFEMDDIKIDGFIARHGITRSSRREQRFYVNGRAIDALACFNGVKNGYGSLVEKGCYPPVVLFIQINPMEIDINVHPAKREIRFHRERIVTNVIFQAIINLLQETTSPAISVDTSFSLRAILAGSEIEYFPKKHVELVTQSLPIVSNLNEDEVFSVPPCVPNIAEEAERLFKQEKIPPPRVYQPHINPEQGVDKIEGLPPIEPIAVIAETYILAIYADGFVVIDQHAAHERVLFETLIQRAQGKLKDKSLSQPMLMPIVIDLSRGENLLVRKYGSIFEEIGFEISAGGPTTIIMSAIPSDLPVTGVMPMFHHLLDSLYEEEVICGKKLEIDALARAACKAAVKAHDRLTLQESKALIAQMATCKMPFSCPHGRPTIIQFSTKDLEKRFARSK